MNATSVQKEPNMKMTLISTVSTWVCATGVAIVASYCTMTSHQKTPAGQKRAAEVAARIAKDGTISEYKSKNRHSSAISKTTKAKVTKVVKMPTYVPNPIFPSFTNALNKLTVEIAEMAKDGEVVLTNGFVLALKDDGRPTLKFPEAYGNVVVGDMAMGEELKNADFWANREWIPGTDRWKVDSVALGRYKRLDEPEFYCTDVWYYALPSTRQIGVIRMHGNLIVGNATKTRKMVKEITEWMKEDYGATELRADTPADKLALKKFRVGKELNVKVTVSRKCQVAADGCDADIDIVFTTGELVKDNQYERQELGKATDEARIRELEKTGVNYFTVRPTVNADRVKEKVVY